MLLWYDYDTRRGGKILTRPKVDVFWCFLGVTGRNFVRKEISTWGFQKTRFWNLVVWGSSQNFWFKYIQQKFNFLFFWARQEFVYDETVRLLTLLALMWTYMSYIYTKRCNYVLWRHLTDMTTVWEWLEAE